MRTRRQATLYLPAPHAAPIERLRAAFNPAQHALIRAHVTLCREDEVADWEDVARRLGAIESLAITLAFGHPVRSGNLVYLPAVGSTARFHQLRLSLLDGPGRQVRSHDPHITLIHPRNGSCSDEIFASLVRRYTPFEATFRTVSLIVQIAGEAWRDLPATVSRSE